MSALDDRVAVVTHGQREPGLAICAALEQAGARVVPAGAQESASVPDLAALIERTTSRFGRVDLMVNTHVVPPGGPFETMPLAVFEQDITANLTGMYFGCQFAAEQMRRQSPPGGCIINVSSVGGVVALPGHAAFCAAMAGINAVTKVLETEWQPYGIRVVGVGVGLTRELADSLQVHPPLPGDNTPSHRRIPEHMLTNPSEVGQAVVYLASEAGRHVAGTTLYVDGGFLADGYWE